MITQLFAKIHTLLSIFFILLLSSFLASCTSLLTGIVINPAISNLQKQQDIDLVCEGAPAYLLMIDSLIESNPTSRELLLTGTKAYSGTVAALTSCKAPTKRIASISTKAKDYGQRLLAPLIPIHNSSSLDFDTSLSDLAPAEAPYLFWGAFGWLSWIQQQQGSPQAMADLIVVEKVMNRLLELDETIERGGPHLFFGALFGSKPAMIGGDPELSRAHFERALEISQRSFLLVQTTYAETYCRMTFNKELHDSLLNEVLEYPLEQSNENALTNQIAKRKAKELLDDNFFD